MAAQSHGSKAERAKTARLPTICNENAFGGISPRGVLFAFALWMGFKNGCRAELNNKRACTLDRPGWGMIPNPEMQPKAVIRQYTFFNSS